MYRNRERAIVILEQRLVPLHYSEIVGAKLLFSKIRFSLLHCSYSWSITNPNSTHSTLLKGPKRVRAPYRTAKRPAWSLKLSASLVDPRQNAIVQGVASA
jgi:hypothetical protein